MPRLLRLLDDPEKYDPSNAAMTLGRIGPAARAAVPLLRTMAQDKADQLRLWAVRILGIIAPEG